MKDWADITKTRRLDMLERVVFPAIGKLPIREITPHHILKILQKTAKHGVPIVAAEARRTISSWRDRCYLYPHLVYLAVVIDLFTRNMGWIGQ